MDETSRDQKYAGDGVASQGPGEVAEVARALASHGSGAASYDLALDLVLHQVVEEARFATRATGAAIALARAGEMVCRATSGPDAPDLGVRLETASGLSGACLQSGMVQQCSDTATDPRVNAEACRRLGVRSILVLPLADGPEPFGVLEVFSSSVDAFGDRDIRELQILARRVVENKRNAERGGLLAPGAVLPWAGSSFSGAASNAASNVAEKPTVPAAEPRTEPGIEPELNLPPAEPATQPRDAELARESEAEPFAMEAPASRNSLWTPVLGILVIATAVLLGVALGWRGAIRRGWDGRRNRAASGDTKRGTNPASAQANPGIGKLGIDSGAGELASPPGDPAAGNGDAVAPPNGGLVVTQNGKVIYRLPSAEDAELAKIPAGGGGSGGESSKTGQPDRIPASRLIHRVEPEYPPEARAQKIQGPVTLEVQIGSEGAVHNIAVLEGDPLLAEAAVQAVRQWKYRPYTLKRRPVEMQTRVTIRFTLPAN